MHTKNGSAATDLGFVFSARTIVADYPVSS